VFYPDPRQNSMEIVAEAKIRESWEIRNLNVVAESCLGNESYHSLLFLQKPSVRYL